MACRARIFGRVQGVWFRGWTIEEAGRLGLSGWVRNRRDGSVEAVFAGAAEVIETMLERCLEGPPMAAVERIERSATDEVVDAGFRQLPTA